MKKYLFTFKTALQKAYTYRWIQFIWLISSLITPIILITLWNNNENSVAGLTKGELITYYFILATLVQTITPHVDKNISDDINSGRLNNFLTKPYKYIVHRYVNEIPYVVQSAIYFIIPGTVIFIIFRNVLTLPNLTFTKGLSFILICFLSYNMQFLLNFWVFLPFG